jgi:hypothetical protein
VRLWTFLMVATGVVMSFVLTCITPFPAIAAFAARTVSLRWALVAVLGALVGNQIVGFTWLGYPHTLATFMWGPMMALACLAGLAAAWPIRNLLLAFLASFVAYEAVMVGFSAFTHTLADFSAADVLQVGEANLIGFAALAVLRIAVVAAERAAQARDAHAHR